MLPAGHDATPRRTSHVSPMMLSQSEIPLIGNAAGGARSGYVTPGRVGFGPDAEELQERYLHGEDRDLPTRPEDALAGAGPDLADFMAHDPVAQVVAEAQARLPAAQQFKLEAILQERAKLLSRFFEQQLKKQYDTMKKEVSRLAKQHERDVHSLDERFKAKMGGLGKRFKALEAAEAKIHLVCLHTPRRHLCSPPGRWWRRACPAVCPFDPLFTSYLTVPWPHGRIALAPPLFPMTHCRLPVVHCP
jgi:hypothetical protein